jgi:hypothetical protein
MVFQADLTILCVPLQLHYLLFLAEAHSFSPLFGPDPIRSLPISVPGTDLGKHFGLTVDHVGTYI